MVRAPRVYFEINKFCTRWARGFSPFRFLRFVTYHDVDMAAFRYCANMHSAFLIVAYVMHILVSYLIDNVNAYLRYGAYVSDEVTTVWTFQKYVYYLSWYFLFNLRSRRTFGSRTMQSLLYRVAETTFFTVFNNVIPRQFEHCVEFPFLGNFTIIPSFQFSRTDSVSHTSCWFTCTGGFVVP